MKILRYCLLISSVIINAQLVEFRDKTSKNMFVGQGRSMCSVTTNNDKDHYHKAYDCGNGSIKALLNVNVLNPALLGQQLYIFNDFMYWIGKNAAKGKINNIAPDTHFSGSGVFMIVVSTSPYLQQQLAPEQTCPAGQSLVMAQLQYNDGNSLSIWSQDTICLSPTDTFGIQVSSDQDTTAPGYVPSSSNDTYLTQTAGPAPAVYQQAQSSPRKIRMVRMNASPKNV